MFNYTLFFKSKKKITLFFLLVFTVSGIQLHAANNQIPATFDNALQTTFNLGPVNLGPVIHKVVSDISEKMPSASYLAIVGILGTVGVCGAFTTAYASARTYPILEITKSDTTLFYQDTMNLHYEQKRNAQYVGAAMIAGSLGGLALLRYWNR